MEIGKVWAWIGGKIDLTTEEFLCLLHEYLMPEDEEEEDENGIFAE